MFSFASATCNFYVGNILSITNKELKAFLSLGIVMVGGGGNNDDGQFRGRVS